MEPVGWVSCGCGKGVTIYARKQQAQASADKVLQELSKTPLEAHLPQAAPKPKAAALHQRLCALCKQPFTGRKHLKYCTYDCYLENLAKKATTAELEPPTAVEAAWKTSPEETKELLEALES